MNPTLASFFAMPWLSPLLMRLATRIDRPLLRISGGRLRLSFIIPVLLLRCRGAKSGLPRETPLLYIAWDGRAADRGDTGALQPPEAQSPTVLLIASNAGQASTPAWYHNLKASSEVEVLIGKVWQHYGFRELMAEERQAAWQAALAVYPGYAHYAARTQRQIPVLLLYPLGPAVDQQQTGRHQRQRQPELNG